MTNISNTPWHAENSSIACLFSFPFPIYVDTESRFSLIEEKVWTETVRFYPFFRSGPANFNSAPPIDLCQVPQPGGRNISETPLAPHYLPLLTAIPTLNGEPSGSATLTMDPLWDNRPRFFPMDSLRVDILGSSSKSPGFASEVVNQLLRHIRVLTRQWWIGIGLVGTGYYQRQILPISRKGIFTGRPESYGSFITPCGNELPLDDNKWHRAITDTKNNQAIADYEDLLLDAQSHAAKNETRRAIIDLSVACEQACESTFIRIIAQKKMKKYKRGRYLKGNDLTKHLNRDLHNLCEISLNQQAPEIDNYISELWSLRGDFAHGRKQEISRGKMRTLIKSAEDCVRWLESLTAPS